MSRNAKILIDLAALAAVLDLAQGGGVVPALCGEKTIKIIHGIALLTWE